MSDTSTETKRRPLKFIKWLLILLVPLLLLGAVAYVGLRMLVGPAEGTIVNVDPYTQSAPAKKPVEFEQFEGTYLTFARPGNYTPQPASKDNSNSLETHTFVASGMMNKILTVTVTKLPSGKLEDDPSYYMRSLHPETYSIKPQTLQGDKLAVVRDNTNAQLAAFWPHKNATGSAGNVLLSFSLSGASVNSADTAAEYQKMLESVRWR